MRYGFACFAAGALALSLTACNTNSERLASGDAPAEDRYHEKSFSWTETDGPLAKGSALAALAARHTRFSSAEEMRAALQSLNERLDDKVFTDSLWKPLDYVCDELDLAAWNTYGTIWLGDSVVFDETRLRERCDAMIPDTLSPSSALGKFTATNPPSTVNDRQYPYKMIGHSWSDEDRYVYRTSGAETQFVKHRTKFFTTAWWGTDASRIGIRTYYFKCGSRLSDNTIGERACVQITSGSDWDANDDYVSDRFINTIADIVFTLSLQPTVAAHPDIKFGSSKVYDGVVGMHSVNHAGLIFRAVSSSGLGVANIGVARQYVTW